MLIIFCANTLEPRQVDASYEAEAHAARTAGHQVALVNFEALVNDGDAMRATRRVPEHSIRVSAVYRGWMMRPDQDHLGVVTGVVLAGTDSPWLSVSASPDSFSMIAEVGRRLTL